MILIIDNYDSFTYNLYQLVGEFEKDIQVYRNDEITVEEIKKLQPSQIIISPGPGNPENERDFGVSKDTILEVGKKIPVLGVCLGHQGIFTAFGGQIIRTEPVHGKQTQIIHQNNGMFQGVSSPLPAARYHSLVCKRDTTPESVDILAETDEGMIMAIKHHEYPIFGLQFHPESIGTHDGKIIMKNFLEMEVS
ncbi:anthranilate synthase component II [Methanobacterium petrolearium]|uniref:anthranilate synthase component II n=1 Tax=Methanobacterium petrolearium TaxID=710190 RepID=UPI001AE4217D|nr:aminodeoxychorismate/anthranilate synthase component II [Methanobacterium petrolearium]MBP1946870.1 anthranilate synthase component 2 [Methanobacterium petrolearium]BDZ70484.1 aminodeoxychorismate/anthranilate synthase component II [Methanobacterium petrolearium]